MQLFHAMESFVELAAICWDSDGPYLGASAVAEAIACREGLCMASDLTLERLQIATDCKGFVDDIADGGIQISCGYN